jgi:hypothetical protein
VIVDASDFVAIVSYSRQVLRGPTSSAGLSPFLAGVLTRLHNLLFGLEPVVKLRA